MRRARGFSLIEVLISVAILAMITVMAWSSQRSTFRAKKSVEAAALRYRTVRLALMRMARDLEMAFLSQNEDTSQAERRTLFVGKHHNPFDEVRFSYFGHQRLYQDAAEADTAQVVYYTARDRENSRVTNLLRRETRRLAYLRPTDHTNEVDILCDDVVGLRLRYWDARDKQWRDEWVTNTADGQPDRLPSRVQIVLTVHDERGKEVGFTTEARIMMQEPLNLRANDLVAPGATPAPGTPGAPGTPNATNKPSSGAINNSAITPGATPGVKP